MRRSWDLVGTLLHSGSGGWEYIFAVGSSDEADTFAARVKLQLAAGVEAVFDNVSVFEIPDRPG